VVVVIALALFVSSNFVGSVDKILTDSILSISLQIAVYYGLAGLCAVVAFRKQVFNSATNLFFLGFYPLLGAVFMFWIFGEAIPNQTLIVNVMGIGLLLVGVIPITWYYLHGSEFLRTRPTLGRTPVDTELPEALIDTILPERQVED
jgi:hypothetical protein